MKRLYIEKICKQEDDSSGHYFTLYVYLMSNLRPSLSKSYFVKRE